MKVYPERVVASYRFYDPVSRGVGLRNEGTEKAVPNDQNAGIIPVKIVLIHAVVHAVVRRRIENELDHAGKPVDEFGMDPELVDQIESVHEQKHPRGKSEKHYRRVEDPVQDAAEPTLTDGNTEVEMLTRMMHDVEVPKEAGFVAYSMKPVVGKVVNEKQQDP